MTGNTTKIVSTVVRTEFVIERPLKEVLKRYSGIVSVEVAWRCWTDK
jgi:hypothetical protein